MTISLYGLVFTLCFFAMEGRSLAQDHDTTIIPGRLLEKMDAKTTAVSEQLSKKTSQYLARFASGDRKLQRKLKKLDSTIVLPPVDYSSFTNTGSNYIPALDSLKCAFQFLHAPSQLSHVNSLQQKLQLSNAVSNYIKERQQQIKAALASYTKLPAGITRMQRNFNKDAYYYQAQVNEYKAMLHDPDKAQQKALALLNETPAFKDFMSKHSYLATLFPQPANYGTPAALAGLQTREQVQQIVNTQVAGGGTGAADILSQRLQDAKTQLATLKDKLDKGIGSADNTMPGFKPNIQHTKSLLQRLEYGATIQSSRSNSYFPATSDIGVYTGYRLNDKSLAGVGVSYKLGWGKDIGHIHFSSQGICLRSFFDYKIKGSFWVSGGAEMNYNSAFTSINDLRVPGIWNRSALVGISKQYSISKKVKGDIRLLYDLLWKEQTPRGELFKFRIGYSLK
jgi:hypothetical protein